MSRICYEPLCPPALIPGRATSRSGWAPWRPSCSAPRHADAAWLLRSCSVSLRLPAVSAETLICDAVFPPCALRPSPQAADEFQGLLHRAPDCERLLPKAACLLAGVVEKVEAAEAADAAVAQQQQQGAWGATPPPSRGWASAGSAGGGAGGRWGPQQPQAQASRWASPSPRRLPTPAQQREQEAGKVAQLASTLDLSQARRERVEGDVPHLLVGCCGEGARRGHSPCFRCCASPCPGLHPSFPWLPLTPSWQAAFLPVVQLFEGTGMMLQALHGLRSALLAGRGGGDAALPPPVQRALLRAEAVAGALQTLMQVFSADSFSDGSADIALEQAGGGGGSREGGGAWRRQRWIGSQRACATMIKHPRRGAPPCNLFCTAPHSAGPVCRVRRRAGQPRRAAGRGRLGAGGRPGGAAGAGPRAGGAAQGQAGGVEGGGAGGGEGALQLGHDIVRGAGQLLAGKWRALVLCSMSPQDGIARPASFSHPASQHRSPRQRATTWQSSAPAACASRRHRPSPNTGYPPSRPPPW